MKTILFFLLPVACLGQASIRRTLTVDSLGACQGVSMQKGNVYLYGDREVGMVREYNRLGDSLVYTGREVKFSIDTTDVIGHPTGFAIREGYPTFIGNSIRLNKEGTRWKAVISCVDWPGLWKIGKLQGNLLNTIEDDACIQGTRPEYIDYKGHVYVATADYGNNGNQVRLYRPEKLKSAKKTSEPGLVYARFTCSPFVQNLHWIPEKRQLVLVQNQVEGRRWRLTFLDFDKSIAEGKEHVLRVIDFDPADELEGFVLLPGGKDGIAVTSSRKRNVHVIEL
ncbi:hypothetical protein [Siphonobacter aquaeclarae]|uniref:Uncharacterized protein n=1 Tax=Siphonobacter aquaeclarae TaxID=563176 RepID=A0A1G9PL86_9BACT|nr:hypothetical protein [Siphonobacter aquaeclarae]SDL99271.1 hypothetical protein SAMN04488090_2218 [Siphonobacter aquaeclarae]